MKSVTNQNTRVNLLRARTLGGALLFSLGAFSAAQAQFDSGALLGDIKDPSGANISRFPHGNPRLLRSSQSGVTCHSSSGARHRPHCGEVFGGGNCIRFAADCAAHLHIEAQRLHSPARSSLTRPVAASPGPGANQALSAVSQRSDILADIYSGEVRRLVSFVAILLLFITAAPVLACVTDASMTHEERACCRSMHGDCGEMAKTGCCRTEFHADVYPQLPAAAPHVHLAFIIVAWLAPAIDPVLTVNLSSYRLPNEHSPPGLLMTRMTVLQI